MTRRVIVGVAANQRASGNRRRLTRHDGGRDADFTPGDVPGRDGNESHVAVDPAAENVLAGARGKLRVPVVVDANGEQVRFSRADRGSDVEREAGVSTLMASDQLSI